jgi:hypothetical protein
MLENEPHTGKFKSHEIDRLTEVSWQDIVQYQTPNIIICELNVLFLKESPLSPKANHTYCCCTLLSADMCPFSLKGTVP